MRSVKFIIIALICLSIIGGASVLFMAHVLRTKVVVSELNQKIDLEYLISEIEQLTGSKQVSAFHNTASIFAGNRIHKIEIHPGNFEGSENGIKERFVGRVWLTDDEDFKLVMIRLPDEGQLRVTRLHKPGQDEW